VVIFTTHLQVAGHTQGRFNMARYFAEIDQSDTVIRVIVSEPEYINSGRVGNPSNWIECFLDEDGVNNTKKMYPGIGHKYNYNAEVFHRKQPYPSWNIDENYDWQSPIPKPDYVEYDGNNIDLPWLWDESTQSWVN
jgi:hypothetical protein